MGCVGLIEEEWMATLAAVDPATLQYIDFVEVGTRLAKELRVGVGYLPLDEFAAFNCTV